MSKWIEYTVSVLADQDDQKRIEKSVLRYPVACAAVIEAAEALVADLGMLEGCELPFPLHNLIHAQRKAVETLQEARDE